MNEVVLLKFIFFSWTILRFM